MGFKIRSISEKDYSEVSLLIERSIQSGAMGYNRAQKKYWTSLYSKENFKKYTCGWNFWVLCDGKNALLGCIGLNKEEIKCLFIEPVHTGMGLGKKLLNYAEVFAAKNGVKKLSLESSPNAVHFYKRNNYLVLGKSMYETHLQKGSIEVTRMVKKLVPEFKPPRKKHASLAET